MSLSKSKCWYSNNCLHFFNCAVPLLNNTTLKEENHARTERCLNRIEKIMPEPSNIKMERN